MTDNRYNLITGGAGFVGSNLADALLSDGERVIILDNLSRAGAEVNLSWLRTRHGSRVEVEIADVADSARVRSLVQGAGRVYHLAAQVAVTTSLTDPRADLETNLLGTFNLLEAARTADRPPAILYTSTNKVYGSLDDVEVARLDGRYHFTRAHEGIGEGRPLDFHSPYGCSKGAADQYVHDYARVYGVPTVVFRMSCIYGRRQFGTEDQGWVAHFARSILAGSPLTIFGDGCQVRDLLWVGDLVRAMRRAMDRIEVTAGEVFNIGGGVDNAVAVRQVIERLLALTGRDTPVRSAAWRPGDQKVYVSDTRKAQRMLAWSPTTHWEQGLEMLLAWLVDADLDHPVPAVRPDTNPAPARVAL